MDDRHLHWRAGIRWLSFYKGHSVKVVCGGCNVRKNYRVDSILDRIGDVSVGSLPVTLARTMGCKRVDLSGHTGCRMAIPTSSFQPLVKPPSSREFLKFPPDAHRLEDTELGNVPAWYVLSGFCKCGHFRNVDMQRLRAKFPPSARTDHLARHLGCKRCGNTKDNFFIFQRMIR